MYNNFQDVREKKGTEYLMSLYIPEEEYFNVYDSIGEMNAKELLENYLTYRDDDGIPKEVLIKHNKNEHIVCIRATLDYTRDNHVDELRIEHL